MGGPGSRAFPCLFSRRRPVLEAPAFEGVEKRGALGCGDADESRQAFEEAMIASKAFFPLSLSIPRIRSELHD